MSEVAIIYIKKSMNVLVSKMTKEHMLCVLKLWIGYDEMFIVSIVSYNYIGNASRTRS